MNPDKIIKRAGLIILSTGILIGCLYHYPKTWACADFINQFYANLSTELISISITILLIDYLYELKEKLALKARLKRELGSEDKGFTSRALKELREFGWLTDGSLNSIDLSNANLSGLDLSNADLTKVNLSNAKLKGCNLTNANLTETNLTNADLSEAILLKSVFKKTILKECTLYAAKINETQLSECDFIKANIELGQLRGCTIENCFLEEANLAFTNFEDTTFKSCKLIRANMSGTNLKNTIFERVDIQDLKNWDKIVSLNESRFNGSKNPPAGFLEQTKN